MKRLLITERALNRWLVSNFLKTFLIVDEFPNHRKAFQLLGSLLITNGSSNHLKAFWLIRSLWITGDVLTPALSTFSVRRRKYDSCSSSFRPASVFALLAWRSKLPSAGVISTTALPLEYGVVGAAIAGSYWYGISCLQMRSTTRVSQLPKILQLLIDHLLLSIRWEVNLLIEVTWHP